MIPANESPKKPDLQKQYELVLQEYRFQVQLNWDRAKHFLIFNTAILAAAVALYKSGSTPIAKLGIGALMLLSALNSFIGRHAVAEGHRFYREIRNLKTRLESELGLGDFAIASTPGMKRGRGEAPEGTPKSGRGRLLDDAKTEQWITDPHRAQAESDARPLHPPGSYMVRARAGPAEPPGRPTARV